MPETYVSCARCGKRLRVPPGSEGRRARCPDCGAAVELAASVSPPAPSVASRSEPEPGHAARPGVLWCAVVLLALLGLGALPLALVSEVAMEVSQEHPRPTLGPAGLLLMIPVGLALVAGAVGLLRRQAWGRVVALFALLFGTAYYAKLMLPVLTQLRWEHPDAPRIATLVLLFQGLPLLGFLLALGLLFVPGLRAALTRPRLRRR